MSSLEWGMAQDKISTYLLLALCLCPVLHEGGFGRLVGGS